MLTSLKRKFVFINMALVFAVLTLVLVGSLLATGLQFSREYHTALKRELSNDIGEPVQPMLKPHKKGEDPDNRSFKMSFSASMDSSGIWTLRSPWLRVDEATLKTLTDRSTQEARDIGFWTDQGIAYQREGNRIAFVNMQSEHSQFKNTAMVLLATYLGALALFLVISLLLSRWALKPVERSWAQQKQFVSDASHELKTPLTVILANLDIARSELGSNQWVDVAQTEALQMKQLIENMLFLTRSDEAQQAPVKALMSMSALANETALAFEPLAYEQGLHFDTQVEDKLMIHADAALMRRLLCILLDNAIKYTQKGGAITLNLHRAKDRMHLSVNNSPAFIPPEQLEHVFDRFFRADEARTKTEGSYGLGLSIAYEIARQHEAVLNVSSKKKEGTTFSLSLPVAV